MLSPASRPAMLLTAALIVRLGAAAGPHQGPDGTLRSARHAADGQALSEQYLCSLQAAKEQTEPHVEQPPLVEEQPELRGSQHPRGKATTDTHDGDELLLAAILVWLLDHPLALVLVLVLVYDYARRRGLVGLVGFGQALLALVMPLQARGGPLLRRLAPFLQVLDLFLARAQPASAAGAGGDPRDGTEAPKSPVKSPNRQSTGRTSKSPGSWPGCGV